MSRREFWADGHGMLGDDWFAKVCEVIDERMQSLHDGNSDCREHLLEFLKVDESLREQCWSRFEDYVLFCMGVRVRDGMGAFDIRFETIDRIRDAVNDRRYPQGSDFRTRQFRRFAESVRDVEFRLRPEFEGVKHPLYLPPASAGERERTAQCQAALDLFLRTGSCVVPEPEAKRRYLDWCDRKGSRMSADGKPRMCWSEPFDGYCKPQGLSVVKTVSVDAAIVAACKVFRVR